MDRKDDCEMLRKVGFAEAEVKELSRLRRNYYEELRQQAAMELRRFEFIRWLVDTGKITDHIA
ncbi:MAG TPA: hypothetical protein VFQ30_11315 [Ktedonobacteraceae bacterium]|nr:hypothetical protein [Ktedonobacteraceae bacterium]